MRVIILGGDGYLGWPTAMHFAQHGHNVTVVDNYLRREIVSRFGRPDRAQFGRNDRGFGVGQTV